MNNCGQDWTISFGVINKNVHTFLVHLKEFVNQYYETNHANKSLTWAFAIWNSISLLSCTSCDLRYCNSL